MDRTRTKRGLDTGDTALGVGAPNLKRRRGDGEWEWTRQLKESDDLVVGGGIRGVSAAHFYRRKHGGDKRVPILYNHDDFSGHAKRNELAIDGQTLITCSGSQTIVEPKHASRVARSLLEEIGVDGPMGR